MSHETEQSLLGSILLDQRCFEKAKPLNAADFSAENHVLIYKTMMEMAAKQIHIDVITVHEELLKHNHDLLDYLHNLSQSSSGGYGVARYAEIIRADAKRRSLIDAIGLSHEVATSKDSFSTKIDKITSLFLELQRDELLKVPKSLAEIALQRTQHYEDLQAGKKIAGWPTHIPSLDKRLNGGLRPGCQYVLAARPSIGKSSFAQYLGLTQARDGRTVLFLSQEMAEEELADRGVSNKGRIDYSNLLSGNLSADDWSRAVDALEAPELANFYVDDQPALTLQDVRSKAKQIKGLSVLIIDYLQLCSGDSGNRNAEIESISRGLKTLAKELKIAIIVLSQLNRQVEQRVDKRPNLSDLRDSGAIEQDADVVMFLWPVRDLSEGARLVGLGIDKNRSGSTGQFGLHFQGNHQFWSESTESVEKKLDMKRGFNE